MSPLLWGLTGAGAPLVASTAVGMVIDERVRRDLSAALLGALALPIMVPATLVILLMDRIDIGLRSMSNRALARFANQRQREDIERHAWMFSFAGRGVILVRKRPRPTWSRPASERSGDVRA